MVNKDWYHWTSEGLQLRLQVQTRASVNKFAEILEDRIKLRIMASAVNGKANEAIIKLSLKRISYAKIVRTHIAWSQQY